MAIFGVLDVEPKVQVNDKTRLQAKRSFVSKDEAAITLVEIDPDGTTGFIDVTGSSASSYFLDWAYTTDGSKTVTLRITTDGAPVTTTETIEVVTAANDKLFSTDQDLLSYEKEVFDLLPDGHSSFNYLHRKVQTLILDWFNEQGYRTTDRSKITVDELLDTNEIRRWSESWVLHHIYKDNSNSVGDKFDEKAANYQSRAIDARDRSVFELDLNKDGEITVGEEINVTSVRLLRR